MSEVWRGVGYFQQISLTEFQLQICGKSYPLFYTHTSVFNNQFLEKQSQH